MPVKPRIIRIVQLFATGYEYDIFICYRQKDNKRDGWVTEFVNQLKGELESTFKADISVYFDINLLDGLLETNDVDASFKNKLQVSHQLIFLIKFKMLKLGLMKIGEHIVPYC